MKKLKTVKAKEKKRKGRIYNKFKVKLKVKIHYLIVTLHISSKLNNCNDRYIHTYLYLVIFVIRLTLK